MEKNTVTLDIARYNELYNLEKEIKSGKFLAVSSISGYRFTHYYTTDEIVEQITKANQELSDKVDQLKSRNAEIFNKLETANRELMTLKKQNSTPEIVPKDITLDDVRKMGYWEFRKWKREFEYR